MPTTQPVQPIQQPAIADIRNALQALVAWREESLRGDLKDVERLLRHALEGLGEPNLASVQAAEVMLREWEGSYDTQRNARDVAAVILRAAVTGEIPPTWSTE